MMDLRKINYIENLHRAVGYQSNSKPLLLNNTKSEADNKA